MKFSILVNSRARPAILVEGLFKLQRNTVSLGEIEVLINFDDDDKSIPDLSFFPFVKTFHSPRTPYLHTNINRLYKECSGDFIFCLNDDAHINTVGWDSIALDNLDIYDDKIVCGGFFDDSADRISNDYASFPIISRTAVDILGFVLPNEIMSWGADVFVWRLFSSIGRYHLINDVVLTHVTRNGSRPSDGLRQDMLKSYYNTPEQVGIHNTLPIDEHVLKLKRFIQDEFSPI